MLYKLNLQAETSQLVPVQATLDIRTDDTVNGVFLSVAYSAADFGAAIRPADFSVELSWLSDTAQALSNDTQGQIFTVHCVSGTASVDNADVWGEAFSQSWYVPFPDGLKVQSGERIYLNAIPHRTWEGMVLRACATIQTKGTQADRAIRRR